MNYSIRNQIITNIKDTFFFLKRNGIAFYSTQEGHHEIYVMDADDSHQRRLTNHLAYEYWHSWTVKKKRVEN